MHLNHTCLGPAECCWRRQIYHCCLERPQLCTRAAGPSEPTKTAPLSLGSDPHKLCFKPSPVSSATYPLLPPSASDLAFYFTGKREPAVHHSINIHSWGGGYFFILFFCFLGPHQQRMEVSRLGVESELQLLAYATATATATATPDPSHTCDLHHSSWQYPILNPLSKARDQSHIFMDTSQVCNPRSHNGNSYFFNYSYFQSCVNFCCTAK